MVSKKNDTSWIASGLRAGLGVMAVDVEAVAVAEGKVGVERTTVSGDADLGVSTLSVVGLLGAGTSSPDTPDTGVIGSEGILDFVP